MFSWGQDVAVDLGTASVLVYVKGRGVVLREPSVVAIEQDTRRILAIGDAARQMIGRTPGSIVAVRPLRNGVIADYDVTEAMLKYFLERVCGKWNLFRPRVMVCIPSGVTSVEKRAVREAAIQAGAKGVSLIEEPLAAALGAGLDIRGPAGHMVVDIGGGTTGIAVLSLGGIVIGESIRVAGDRFDEAIVKYIKREHNLAIGERTAEEVKMKVGCAFPGARDVSLEVRGRDLVDGLPKTIEVTSAETCEALAEPVAEIVDRVKSVLERTPPELAGDIVDRGIVLTGGGSLLFGMDKTLSYHAGVPVHLADDPVSSVVVGAGKALMEYPMVHEDHVPVLKRIM
ncbi:MAG: rod shape-determining protein MreB [Firmicutes bacterium]|nr:rod shape-determining protein MreB [Bacillota bacterium]